MLSTSGGVAIVKGNQVALKMVLALLLELVRPKLSNQLHSCSTSLYNRTIHVIPSEAET